MTLHHPVAHHIISMPCLIDSKIPTLSIQLLSILISCSEHFRSMQEAGMMYDILSFDHTPHCLVFCATRICVCNRNLPCCFHQKGGSVPSSSATWHGPLYGNSSLSATSLCSLLHQSFPMGDLLTIMGPSTASFEPFIPAVNPNSYYHERCTLSVEVVEYSYEPKSFTNHKS